MKKRITNVRAYRYCATELIPRDIETDNIINDDRISILNDDFRNYDSTLSELTDEMYDAVWEYYHSDSENWFDDFFCGCRNRKRMRECVKKCYIDECNNGGWTDDEHLEEILNSYYDVDDWEICEIHGCVQRDWCKIAYRKSLVTENEIDVFESALFNTGTAYEIYDYVEDDYLCVVYVPCRTVDHLSYIAKELECTKEKIKIA